MFASLTVATTTVLSICQIINPIVGTIVIVGVGYYTIKHHHNKDIKDELEIERMKKKDASND